MRTVPDTNIVVSGLLWSGPPRHVLTAARAGHITLYTTQDLLDELVDVLSRPKLAARLRHVGTTPIELISGYTALARVVTPAPLATPICDDPDDDAVIACALAAQAEVIVSGDDDLLRLSAYGSIRILTAPELLTMLASPQP